MVRVITAVRMLSCVCSMHLAGGARNDSTRVLADIQSFGVLKALSVRCAMRQVRE